MELTDSSHNIKFCTDYVAKGMGLVACEQGRKSSFYLYPIPKKHLHNVDVIIRGPYSTCGHIIVPALVRPLVTDYARRFYLSGETFSASPTTQGTAFLRKLSMSYGGNTIDTIEVRIKVTKSRAQVIYFPKHPGIHEISLITNGHHLIGSPFSVIVDPPSNRYISDDSVSEEEREMEDLNREYVPGLVDVNGEEMYLKKDGTLERIKTDEVDGVHNKSELNLKGEKMCAVDDNYNDYQTINENLKYKRQRYSNKSGRSKAAKLHGNNTDISGIIEDCSQIRENFNNITDIRRNQNEFLSTTPINFTDVKSEEKLSSPKSIHLQSFTDVTSEENLTNDLDANKTDISDPVYTAENSDVETETFERFFEYFDTYDNQKMTKNECVKIFELQDDRGIKCNILEETGKVLSKELKNLEHNLTKNDSCASSIVQDIALFLPEELKSLDINFDKSAYNEDSKPQSSSNDTGIYSSEGSESCDSCVNSDEQVNIQFFENSFEQQNVNDVLDITKAKIKPDVLEAPDFDRCEECQDEHFNQIKRTFSKKDPFYDDFEYYKDYKDNCSGISNTDNQNNQFFQENSPDILKCHSKSKYDKFKKLVPECLYCQSLVKYKLINKQLAQFGITYKSFDKKQRFLKCALLHNINLLKRKRMPEMVKTSVESVSDSVITRGKVLLEKCKEKPIIKSNSLQINRLSGEKLTTFESKSATKATKVINLPVKSIDISKLNFMSNLTAIEEKRRIETQDGIVDDKIKALTNSKDDNKQNSPNELKFLPVRGLVKNKMKFFEETSKVYSSSDSSLKRVTIDDLKSLNETIKFPSLEERIAILSKKSEVPSKPAKFLTLQTQVRSETGKFYFNFLKFSLEFVGQRFYT